MTPEREAFEKWWNIPAEAWLRRREFSPDEIALYAWQAALAWKAEQSQPAQEPVARLKTMYSGTRQMLEVDHQVPPKDGSVPVFRHPVPVPSSVDFDDGDTSRLPPLTPDVLKAQKEET